MEARDIISSLWPMRIFTAASTLYMERKRTPIKIARPDARAHIPPAGRIEMAVQHLPQGDLSMKKRSRAVTALLLLLLLGGAAVMLYPAVADWWNARHQSRAVADYTRQVEQLTAGDYARHWEDALAYNRLLAQSAAPFHRSAQEKAQYAALLNLGGDGMMGYLEIPSIHCLLPLCHGTAESVLQRAAGHVEWSSLPVGGESSHCVVSGHRGLSSARLFTDLDKLVVGDIFMFRVLDEILTYEVDQILIVDPHDTEALVIEEGKDLCTLVTCTPYGINSHRLLVRGHRVENQEEAKTVRITSDAVQIEPVIVAPIVALPMLLVLLICLLLPKPKRRRFD